MEVTPWGVSFINTLALLTALADRTGSELLTLTIVDDIVEVTLEKGDSIFTMPLHIDKLTDQNVMDVLINLGSLAQMEHAGFIHSNKTLH